LIRLLDVNVLIALADPSHVSHDKAHDWFAQVGRAGWATCPITENGLVRILSNPKYPNSPGGPAEAAMVLSAFVSLPGHAFWPDSISLRDAALFAHDRIGHAANVTDAYLLALAVANGGALATLDRRLSPVAVHGGRTALRIIGGDA